MKLRSATLPAECRTNQPILVASAQLVRVVQQAQWEGATTTAMRMVVQSNVQFDGLPGEAGRSQEEPGGARKGQEGP